MCISFYSFLNRSFNFDFVLPVPPLYIECEYICSRRDNLPFSSQAARSLGTMSKPDGKDCALPRDHGLSWMGFLSVSLGMKCVLCVGNRVFTDSW